MFILGVNAVVVAIIVVTDHIILSCGQLIFSWCSTRLLLSFCGGGWCAKSFCAQPKYSVEVVLRFVVVVVVTTAIATSASTSTST